jgi:hypothetical protein
MSQYKQNYMASTKAPVCFERQALSKHIEPLDRAGHNETCSFYHKVLTEEEIHFLQTMDLER